MTNIYNYQRISTRESNDKQSYARQQSSLDAYAKENGVEYLSKFKDDCSGSSFDRPEWKKLEQTIKLYDDKVLKSDDTIVFKDISRFTRQGEEGYIKYMELLNKGYNLVFLDNPTVSTDYIRNLTNIAEGQQLVTKTALEGTIKLLIIVELDRVEQERLIIQRRIIDGIKASPNKSGRKPNTLDKMTYILKEDIIDFLSNRSIKQVDLMRKHSISRNTLKKYINYIIEGRNMKGYK